MVNRGMVHDGSWWFMMVHDGSWWFMDVHGFGFATFQLHDRLTSWLPPGSSGFRALRWCLGGTNKWLKAEKQTENSECLIFSNLGKTRQMLFLQTGSTFGLKSNFCERWHGSRSPKRGMAWHQTWSAHMCIKLEKAIISHQHRVHFLLGFCVIFCNCFFAIQGFHPRGQLLFIWRWNCLKMGYP